MTNASKPKYQIIKDDIYEKIRNNTFKPDDRLPSENELIEIYSISSITARKALDDLVSEHAVYRIKGKGTFVAKPEVSEINPFGSNNEISILMPTADSLDNSVFQILQSSQKYLAERDYRFQLGFSGTDINQERKFLENFITGGTRGLICFSLNPDANYDLFKQMLDLGLPFVLIDRGLKNTSTNLVRCDNFDGTYQSTKFLISKGHTKIAIMTMDDFLVSEKLRVSGYTEALKEAGINYENSLIYNSKDLNLFLSDVRAKQITAVVCVNDITASRVMRYGIKAGIEVPSELSIIGFDNSIICKHLPVKLTTVHQPFDEIGRAAAELIDQLIKTKIEAKSQITLPIRLIQRDSHTDRTKGEKI